MSNLVLSSLSSSNRIKRELLHGETYRSFKSRSLGQPICPVPSPQDVTYFVRRKRRIEKVVEEIDSKGTASHGRLKRRCKSKSEPHIKNSFWERAKLTRRQYIDVLSTPHLQSCGDIENEKKFKSKTSPDLCSPRIIQMSCPTKRRVLATWQDYGDHLPAETLQRFHDMLHTDNNIDLKDARNYFKMRDRKRKRMERRRRLKRKKKKNFQEALWLREQIEETSTAIMNFFSGNPKLDLSFKQLLISDSLLGLLANVSDKKKPILRHSSDLYNRQLVKMVDKIALWIDSVSKIVEIQSLEEEEDQAEAPEIAESESSTVSSISAISEGEKSTEEEGEETEEEEASEEDEGDEDQMADDTGTEDEYETREMKDEKVAPISSLDKLIKILAHASPSYLGGNLDDLENLTRNELLNKIKILNKDYSGAETPAELLKKIITEWALHNQPEEVDKRVKKKIEKVAGLLAAMLAAEDLYGMTSTLPEEEKPSGEPGKKPSEAGQEAAKAEQKPSKVKEKPGKAKEKPTKAEQKPAEAEQEPGKEKKPSMQERRASQVITEIDFGEDGEPIPGTVTEVIAPDGSVQLGVVDDDGNLNPVTMTPSGNLMPTVYDRDGKVVEKLYDKAGDQLDSTFNKYGVPEPDEYSGPLFDDESKPHELIYNEKGKIIPLCYDKDGNPIGAGYDEDGNPIYYGEDGSVVAVPPGGSAKIMGDKLVVFGPDGEEIKGEGKKEETEEGETEEEETGEETEEEPGKEPDELGEEIGVNEDDEEEDEEEAEVKEGEEIEEEVEEEGGEPGPEVEVGEEETEEEEGEEEEEESSTSSESDVDKKSETEKEKKEPSPAASRESMITVIRGHKPKKVYEHSKDTVCCLSLKIWAVWLLEITHNAHSWTKWVSNVIGQIREFAAILRGEVILPNGQPKVLFKNDWEKFVNDVNEDVIAWRQYCRHVNDLTNKIVEKFHGKKVHCCEKCLQDHLIKDVVTAHDTMKALTEALNCAGYWQRCLDATTKLTEMQPKMEESSSSNEETGWSYSSSSDDDDKEDYYCYTKRRKMTPSPTWKKIKQNPCSCPCKLKQLFPKEVNESGQSLSSKE